MSSLKVVTIVVFTLVGLLVNLGVNREHRVIGFSNWFISGAPFVNGFGGFARVFVTASFACEFSVVVQSQTCFNVVLTRWWNRKSGHYCRRDQESEQKHASCSQTGFLEVQISSLRIRRAKSDAPHNRILLFYILSIFIMGLNGALGMINGILFVLLIAPVPYDYPNLSNRSTTTSPFTIVFYEAGSGTFPRSCYA